MGSNMNKNHDYVLGLVKQGMKLTLCICMVAMFASAHAENAEEEYPVAVESEKQAPSLALTYQQNLLAKAPRSIPTYPVSVSSPNRIAVNGSRIINIVYDQNQLEVELDKTSGEAFVIPISGNAITVFVMSENKETHSLTLIPQNILSQNIELRNKRTEATFSPRPMSPNPILRASDFDTAMKNLIVTMARQELPEDFDLIEQEKPTKKEQLKVLKTYISASFIGEELRYTHNGSIPIQLDEKFFSDKDVLAVAIVKHRLEPKESTRIYRVIKRSK